MRGVDNEHKRLKDVWEQHRQEWDVKLAGSFRLFAWQKIAVAFLHRCRQKFGFALLADEMGVGKVIFPFDSLG